MQGEGVELRESGAAVGAGEWSGGFFSIEVCVGFEGFLGRLSFETIKVLGFGKLGVVLGSEEFWKVLFLVWRGACKVEGVDFGRVGFWRWCLGGGFRELGFSRGFGGFFEAWGLADGF